MNKINSQLLENTRRWRKTKRGVVTNLYHKMKGRHEVSFTLQWLHGFAQDKKFNRLFEEWKKSGYKKEKKPTIDRINNKKPYTKTNVHWLPWCENRYKQTMERRSRKRAVIQLKNGKEVARFKSQREAVKKTGLNQSLVSAVLNGKRNHTGGYHFIYSNPELLNK